MASEVSAGPAVTAERGHADQRPGLGAPVRAGPRQFRRPLPAAPPRDRPRPLHADVLRRGSSSGYAGHGWTTLVDPLRARGRHRRRADSSWTSAQPHPRRAPHRHPPRPVIVPVRDDHHRIRRVHRPRHQRQPPRPQVPQPHPHPHLRQVPIPVPAHPRSRRPPAGRVVIVEGALDALASATAAAATGRSDRITAVAATGVTVSGWQADQVLDLSPNPPLIALDGDHAGRDGTDRWITALFLHRHRPALVLHLPDGHDPASWIVEHGPEGLDTFLTDAGSPTRRASPAPWSLPCPAGTWPGSHCEGAADPIRDTIAAVTPLARGLGPSMRATLVAQAAAEMTRNGWNPNNTFTRAIQRDLADLHPSPTRPTCNRTPHEPRRRPATGQPQPRCPTCTDPPRKDPP